MGRMRVTFWPVVGIVWLHCVVLCGLGLALIAGFFRDRRATCDSAQSGGSRLFFSWLRSFLSCWGSFSCDVRFARFLPCGKAEARSNREGRYTRSPSPHSACARRHCFPLHVRALVARQRFRATWGLHGGTTCEAPVVLKRIAFFTRGTW